MSSAPRMIQGSTVPAQQTEQGAQEPALQFDFLDLRAQFQTIREETIQAAIRVLESQHFILGREVQAFENEMAEHLGARHAIGCASGSDALILALMALGIGPGDEVITTPFTFVATMGSIARVGATPVLVDIDPLTFNIDPAGIEAAITPRTRAILPVHLFGLPADMGPILRLAEGKNLHVIEDAAQAIGARYRGQMAGTIGSVGCYSFFPSKNLGGAGDGGLLTTQNPELATRLKHLRVHGSGMKYHHEELGVNSRLDALQAAILRVKLPRLTEWTKARQLHADAYRELFQIAGLQERVSSPPVPSPDFVHVYNQFVVRVRERDNLRKFLRANGIPTEIYYPLPLHLQPAFAYLNYREGQFPVAESASHEALALPIYPELTESQQQQIVQAITHFVYR